MVTYSSPPLTFAVFTVSLAPFFLNWSVSVFGAILSGKMSPHTLCLGYSIVWQRMHVGLLHDEKKKKKIKMVIFFFFLNLKII